MLVFFSTTFVRFSRRTILWCLLHRLQQTKVIFDLIGVYLLQLDNAERSSIAEP